jgi:hypothetical protein
MGIKSIIALIDQEIAQLEQARAILSGTGPRSTKNFGSVAKKKRNLTPEGRKRIAEAVRRRWAEQKRRAAK